MSLDVWGFCFSALHHNNCMFVAHNIQTIEKQFCKKLAQCPLPDRHAKLSDLVPRVRKLGNGNFTQHIIHKKEQICDYLILAEGQLLFGLSFKWSRFTWQFFFFLQSQEPK